MCYKYVSKIHTKSSSVAEYRSLKFTFSGARAQNIDRRYIYLLGWIFVLFPLLYPLGLPVPIGRESRAWKEYIDNIPNDSVIIFSLDYGARAEEFGVKMSWEHATEGHRIAEWIAEKGIPAVWGPSLTARGKWEMRELDFSTPKILHEAGVKFAIQTDALGQPIGFLPLCAGMAVKHGLPYDEALKAITITPAEILGVADRVGSIEKGKDADIRILDGDPLELRTKVEMVLIDGEIVYKA